MKGQPRILAIDSDESFLRFIAEIIGDTCKLFVSGSGEEALTSLGHIRPDIVMLEAVLPGMNGLEACRLFRNRTKAFVMLISGRAMQQDINNGFLAGADAYLTKPFHHDQLLELIDAFKTKRGRTVSKAGFFPMETTAPGRLFLEPAFS